jgi:hypothetical protein
MPKGLKTPLPLLLKTHLRTILTLDFLSLEGFLTKNKEEITDDFLLSKLKKTNLFIIRDFSDVQKTFLSLKSLIFEDSMKFTLCFNKS